MVNSYFELDGHTSVSPGGRHPLKMISQNSMMKEHGKVFGSSFDDVYFINLDLI